jgi:2-amino-4-hydroxy-6-hydroxymethyldihydropteridine diphosphokinase
MTTTAYIGLGANLGDREGTLRQALRMLDESAGVKVRLVSKLIETEPVGGEPNQPKYLNGAAEIETSLSPPQLHGVMKGVETALGRDRSHQTRWGPRTCDLDLLLMGDCVIQTPELTIPHPQMHQRPFVLRPLVEIAPGAIHPVLGKTVAELLAEAQRAESSAKSQP